MEKCGKQLYYKYKILFISTHKCMFRIRSGGGITFAKEALTINSEEKE